VLFVEVFSMFVVLFYLMPVYFVEYFVFVEKEVGIIFHERDKKWSSN